MLLAALAFVLQGALPLMARHAMAPVSTQVIGATQAKSGQLDCHGLRPGAVHTDVTHAKPTERKAGHPGSSGPDRQPISTSTQLECCMAGAGIILLAADRALSPDALERAGAPPQLSVMLEKLVLEGPSKPPRTSYTG